MPVRDYAAQAARVREWIAARKPDARTLLDVACGTGVHLAHLKQAYTVAGVDISPSMAAIARLRNPSVPFFIGDMRTFNLNMRFDVVTCLFSSITYAGTETGLNATLSNFVLHLNPGGVIIIEPYIAPELWRLKPPAIRIVEKNDRKIVMVDRAELYGSEVRREIAYISATSKRLEQIYEVHEFPLFTGTQYEKAFSRAGLDVEFDPKGFVEPRGMYLGILRS